ncbi:hypothetical protein M409DRAFT_71563 [Zasmidium cellare ATCC 36951]|uniref:AB hydrolase-1 domain-containing protein n=1 Tax=Zasmidium cellare ATCC 36951 TaxID=1080233 RepID=A0A6A6BV15_ZASCE|nr:uncharacterized protein M409DRAFT_71563 [Zasmidium cellare ATCC 36951]KAF2158581.1 hypothetical protein M409DRAFT_71563 [Zasmidium cellare ATCC 36951]
MRPGRGPRVAETPPSLVFIAGSWHQGKCYERITQPLETRHQIRCTTVTLTSTLGDPESSFEDDVDAARSAITLETSRSRDVVVIAHSFGGMVGNSAIKGLSRSKSAKSNENITSGAVIGLVLIASGFTLTGLSFMDPMFGIPPPSWKVNKETGFADLVTPPRELFYHDLSAEDADYWFRSGEHAYAGWQDVPTWYIGTTEDRGMPVVVQRMQVGMARAMGGQVVHRELQSSHSPFLSMPDKCVAIILEAIEVFTGKPLDDASVSKSAEEMGEREFVVPAVRLLQPTSWFRYGIPFGLGRFVGNCITAFEWIRSLWRTKQR